MTEDGRELTVQQEEGDQEVSYYDLGDAAGDLNGSDYLNDLTEQHPDEKIVEFRIKYEDGEFYSTAFEEEEL